MKIGSDGELGFQSIWLVSKLKRIRKRGGRESDKNPASFRVKKEKEKKEMVLRVTRFLISMDI